MSPLVCLLAGVAAFAPAGNATPDSAAPDSAETAAAAGRSRSRFLAVLERNPRPGTALDRAADFYAARGKFGVLADRYQTRTFADPRGRRRPGGVGAAGAPPGRRAGGGGGVPHRRGPGAERPTAPACCWRTGWRGAGVDAGAAAALEAALDRDPPRRELPELFLALGRALSRGGAGGGRRRRVRPAGGGVPGGRRRAGARRRRARSGGPHRRRPSPGTKPSPGTPATPWTGPGSS